MTATVAEVVAQLLAAADQLDTAVVTALRAQSDAEQAHSRFTEAGRGSNHPEIRATITESRTAADKAGKVGRLIAQAAGKLTAYANHIAPGSATNRQPSDSAFPSGEDLVAESIEREDRRSVVGGFLAKKARTADDVQDNVSQGVANAEAVTNFFRHPHGSGGHSTGTANPPAPPPPTQPKLDYADAAGNAVVAALVFSTAVHRAARYVVERRKRSRRGNDGEAE